MNPDGHGCEKPQSTAALWLIIAIIASAFLIRLSGLVWGQAYGYFSQGDGIEAYSVAVNYGHGVERAQYIGQPNYNEKSKLPGPLWTMFCFLGLRFGHSVAGVNVALILLNCATIWLIYRFARQQFGNVPALWAAALAATSPFGVYYSVPVYNPVIMPFLGAVLFLSLWAVLNHDHSPRVFWVLVLLFAMPQVHMSGLSLIPGVLILLAISRRRIHPGFLLAGLVAGALLYLPYVRGEINHGWANTHGMVSGRDRFSIEGLKAFTTPFTFLISWCPGWFRTKGEFHDIAASAFGGSGLFIVFNLFVVFAAGIVVFGVFAAVKSSFTGFFRSPRDVFERSRHVLAPLIFIATPLFAAALGGRAFHVRYCLVLLQPIFVLIACGIAWLLQQPRYRRILAIVLLTVVALNAYFMPALFRGQRNWIESTDFFVPSFQQLDRLYTVLRHNATAGTRIQIDDKSFLASFQKSDGRKHDAGLIRKYVEVRELDSGVTNERGEEVVTFLLSSMTNAVARNAAYVGHGIVLTKSVTPPLPPETGRPAPLRNQKP
jgi:hypothetical protein